jgi:hypothetical protein
MTNKDLFKEAIADAKQVREAALANAKSALEEALTPKLQSMLSMKLQEMEEDELDENVEEKMEKENYMNEEEDLEEDFDLSAILAELEDEDKMDEAKDEEDYGTNIVTGEKLPKPDPIVEEEEEGEEEETEGSEEGEEDINIADLSVDDLKDLIKDIISQEMGSDEMEVSDEMGDELDMGVDGEEMMDSEDEEINLDELLAELDALEETKEEKVEESNELEEAINTINTLRTELQEVNLLNAKLLYVNKIFKSKNLTESQKVKVITSFDKATNVKEAKIVYESLESNLNSSTSAPKNTIKESLGFASKPVGSAPSKNQIVEVNDSISRMQRLAGIIKN